MNPIVVAYPRSGSEIITDIVFNYASQIWRSERCLQEFLLMTFFRDNNFEFIDNKIEEDRRDVLVVAKRSMGVALD